MNENQLVGITLIITFIVIYFFAVYIEKSERFTLFSGWNSKKMTNPKAYGKMLCKSLKIFSIIFGLVGLLVLIIQPSDELLLASIILASTVLSSAVLVYYIFKAKKLYGK